MSKLGRNPFSKTLVVEKLKTKEPIEIKKEPYLLPLGKALFAITQQLIRNRINSIKK